MFAERGHPAEGSALRARRLRAGLTIKDLAARTGVSPRTIGGIERGRVRRPHDGTLTALAAELGLNADDGVRLRSALPAESADIGLPRLTPCFTGRDDDLAWVTEMIADTRVVELVGLPGIGKTALAIQAAARLAGDFPDGVRFVDLGGELGLRPETAARHLSRSLGGAAEAGDCSSMATYQRLLSLRRVLLVFDGASDAARVVPLLPRQGPAVAVVTTSRRLGLPPGCARRVVVPLAAAAAGEALRKMLGVDPASGVVRELVGHCHGLPLALRAVANRVRTRRGWPVERFVAQLGDPGRFLGALSAGDLSVRAAFERGYRQLPGSARAAVRALDGIAPPSTSVAELAGCGWVWVGDSGDYEIHPMLRAFAATAAQRGPDGDEGDRSASAW